MKREFTIGRFIISERTQTRLTKVNHQPLYFVEAKNFFSTFFKSNDLVLIDCADEGKTRDYNYDIENCLKPVVKDKEDEQVQNVSNCLRTIIFILTLLII